MLKRMRDWWLEMRIKRAERRLSTVRQRPHHVAEVNKAFDHASDLILRRRTLDPTVRNILEGMRLRRLRPGGR